MHGGGLLQPRTVAREGAKLRPVICESRGYERFDDLGQMLVEQFLSIGRTVGTGLDRVRRCDRRGWLRSESRGEAGAVAAATSIDNGASS